MFYLAHGWGRFEGGELFFVFPFLFGLFGGCCIYHVYFGAPLFGASQYYFYLLLKINKFGVFMVT